MCPFGTAEVNMQAMESLFQTSRYGDQEGVFKGFYPLLLFTMVANGGTHSVIICDLCILLEALSHKKSFGAARLHCAAIPTYCRRCASAQAYGSSSSTLQSPSPSHHHLLVPYILPFYNMLLSQHPGSRVVCWWANSPTILVSKADDARRILSADVNHMQKVRFTIRGLHRLWGRGLLLADGKDWHAQRSILRPAFFAEKLKALVADMATSSLDMIQGWKTRIDEEPVAEEVEVEVARDLKNVTADILSRTMFGTSYLKGKSVFERQEILLEMTNEVRIKMTSTPFYEYLPTGLNRKIRALDRRNNRELHDIIEERRRTVTAGNSMESRSGRYGMDLLGLILDALEEEANLGSKGVHLSTQQVIDNCKTFFFAGHETTANLLAWTMVLLSLNQEWQEKARQEVWEVCGDEGEPNADNLHKLKVVGMILNESLRMYPPVPSFGRRELFESVRIDDGTVLPCGTSSIVLCACIHRDKEIWGDDADEFRPDRFANGVSHACKNPYAFMPFGMGPRTCIGQNFALMEAKVILALILQKFQFRLSPSYRHAPTTAITMRPKHGVQVLLRSLSKN